MKKIIFSTLLLLLNSLMCQRVMGHGLGSHFYLAGEFDLAMINNIILDSKQYNDIKHIKPQGYKPQFLKGFIGDVGDIGLGYRFQRLRVDLRAGHSFSYHHYYSSYIDEEAVFIDNKTKQRYNSLHSYNKCINIQANDFDLSINSYYDLPVEYKGIGVFTFIGYGIASKSIQLVKDNRFSFEDKNKNYLLKEGHNSQVINYENKSNPFYSLGIGLSCRHDSMIPTLDVIYKLKKNLKNNYQYGDGKESIIDSHAHNLIIGIRYYF